MTQNELIKKLDNLIPQNTTKTIALGLQTETTKRNGIIEWQRSQPMAIVEIYKRKKYYYQMITETCTTETDRPMNVRYAEYQHEFQTETGDIIERHAIFTPLEDMPK